MRTAFALIVAAGLVAAQEPQGYDSPVSQQPEDVSSAAPAPYESSSVVEAQSSAPPAYNAPATYAPPPVSTVVAQSTTVAPPPVSTVQAQSTTTHIVVYSTVTAPPPQSTVEAVSTVMASSAAPIYPVPQNSTVLATGTGAPMPTQLPYNAATGLQASFGAAVAGVVGLFAFLA